VVLRIKCRCDCCVPFVFAVALQLLKECTSDRSTSPHSLDVDVRDLEGCPLSVFSDQKAEAFRLLLISGDQDISLFDLVGCFDVEACQSGLDRLIFLVDSFELVDPKKG